MTLMERKRKRRIEIEAMFAGEYQFREISGRKRFLKADGGLFQISCFPGEDALVIEYAESENEAGIDRFEDGDRFYIEDYPDATEMYMDMREEVEY